MLEIPDEEMAFRLVRLYVEEISQRGEKRQMGIDTIINAYFYTLLRLKKKKEQMGLLGEVVEKEQEEMKEDIERMEFPRPGEEDEFSFLG